MCIRDRVYHGTDTEFQEESSVTAAYTEVGAVQNLTFDINSYDTTLRLDMGQTPGEIEISRLYLQYQDAETEIPLSVLANSNSIQQMTLSETESNLLQIKTEGTDPYVIININPVSYTHLDVYKRQGLYIFSENRSERQSGKSGQLPPAMESPV